MVEIIVSRWSQKNKLCLQLLLENSMNFEITYRHRAYNFKYDLHMAVILQYKREVKSLERTLLVGWRIFTILRVGNSCGSLVLDYHCSIRLWEKKIKRKQFCQVINFKSNVAVRLRNLFLFTDMHLDLNFHLHTMTHTERFVNPNTEFSYTRSWRLFFEYTKSRPMIGRLLDSLTLTTQVILECIGLGGGRLAGWAPSIFEWGVGVFFSPPPHKKILYIPIIH